MKFPHLKSPISVNESLIDLDMICTNLSTPEEAGIESPKTNNLRNNLIVPRNELVDSNSTDFPDQTSSPLTAKNLEIFCNSTDSSTSKHRSKSSKASTDHSGSVEEIVKQVEDQDRQELSSIDNTTTATKIASILHLAKTPGTFQLINLRNIDNIELVGDLVGRLIHFDPHERILQKYQHFGPPPVAGKDGLLSWLTSQEKMAEVIIESGSRDYFHWGWNPAIFSRAVRLGVRTPLQVPYQISAQSGNWYKPSNKETRDRVAWEILNETIFTKSGIKPNSYEFRALADDFYSGREVQGADYYAHLTEPDTLADGKGSASSSFHITSIDMDKYGQNLNRNLYGETKESDKSNDLKAKAMLNLFLVEVIKINEIEDALVRVEKDKHLEKSSFTIATVHGTDVRRSPKYHEYIGKLNTLEKNKEEAGQATARNALEDFVHNINIHGLDSIMGSQTWSVTHIRTIPTLDEPVEETTIIESITPNKRPCEPTDETVITETTTPDNGPRSISPLLIPENLAPSNETAAKKKKKKMKGKGNAKKVARQEEDLESTALETTQQTAKITENSSHSIASDPLNYHFDDSTNPVVDDDTNWEVVKPRPIKKGPRAAQRSRPVNPPQPYKQNTSVAVKVPLNQSLDQKREGVPTKASGQIATTITKHGEKFEIKSFNDFPAISSPLKKTTQHEFSATKAEPTAMMEQQAVPTTGLEVSSKLEPTVVVEQYSVPKTDLNILADIEANVDHDLTKSAVQNAVVVSPLIPSTGHAILSMEVNAEDISNATDTNPPSNVDATRTLANEIIVTKVIKESTKDIDSPSITSTEHEVEDIATSLPEKSSPGRGMTLKYDAPIYLGNFLDAPRRRRQYRSSSATPTMFAVPMTVDDDEGDFEDEVDAGDELNPDSASLNERRASVAQMSLDKMPIDKMFIANMKSEAFIAGNAIAARHLSLAESTSMDPADDNNISVDALSALDSMSKDNIVFDISEVAISPVSDIASLDTIVNNVPQVSDSCSLEIGTGNEEPRPPKEATPISISRPSSVISSTMTIHGPQPRGFHPSFMGLNSPNLDFAASTSVGHQTHTQQASVGSFDLAENSLSEFSNGWSRQKLSTSSILHVGSCRHAESSLAQISFDCTYCARHYYATTDSPMVLCNGCGANSGVTYCSVACLLAGSLAHAEVCQESVDNSETPTFSYPTAYQIYYDGTLDILPSITATFKRSAYAYRQKVFAMYCRSGPFPQLLAAWARQNKLLHTLEGQDASEAIKKTGSYFIFKSALTSNGSRTNPDSTVICTIKFRPNDHMLQAVDRCLQACFTTNHEHVRPIKEFLFRLIKDLLSDDDSFDCFPHTEDRTTVFYEFQHQFNLEFAFHADMQRTPIDKFDFQLEWPDIEHLLSQFETGEFI